MQQSKFNYPYHLKFGNHIIGALCINTQSISDAKRIIQHKELMINYGEWTGIEHN
jgi:hypothetical protein